MFLFGLILGGLLVLLWIHVAFLDDLLRIPDGWEEEHPILLMSFAGTF
jgi:hypothetical protein